MVDDAVARWLCSLWPSLPCRPR